MKKFKILLVIFMIAWVALLSSCVGMGHPPFPGKSGNYNQGHHPKQHNSNNGNNGNNGHHDQKGQDYHEN
ncbi:MAG: hypothetical protein WCK09_14290 [Bacteroidota bacterium]